MSNFNEIIPFLYLGNMEIAADPKFFHEHNIKRVVNCTPNVPNYFTDVEYMRIPVYDHQNESDKMKMFLLKAVNFIWKPTKDNAVLVHCVAGISRSSTVVAAYLRYYYISSLLEAINYIIEKRPIAFSNGTRINFSKALLEVFKV